MKIIGNVSKLSEALPNVHNLHNLCKNLHYFENDLQFPRVKSKHCHFESKI